MVSFAPLPPPLLLPLVMIPGNMETSRLPLEMDIRLLADTALSVAEAMASPSREAREEESRQGSPSARLRRRLRRPGNMEVVMPEEHFAAAAPAAAVLGFVGRVGLRSAPAARMRKEKIREAVATATLDRGLDIATLHEVIMCGDAAGGSKM